MSIFNFFKNPNKEGKSQIAQEIDRFIETQKNEIENIENFFEMLSPYQNPETLLMTLKNL